MIKTLETQIVFMIFNTEDLFLVYSVGYVLQTFQVKLKSHLSLT